MQTTAMSVARLRPPRPNFIKGLPPPRKGILSPVRRGIKQLIFAAVDHGWLGLRPLSTHVVMCGFTRSGSTLLLLMAETCVSDVRCFRREVAALAAAKYALRNHTYMITKEPGDLFFVDEIREFYATRRADVRFILTVRDPRAVLTSVHQDLAQNQPSGYYGYPAQWLAYYEHVRYVQQFDDVITVEYKDLIRCPGEVQRKLTEFIGWHVHVPFELFHTVASSDFDSLPLNGVRPLDPTRLESWRQEKHRARIRQILQELPELPQYLIEMGYEPDASWAQTYL